MLTPLNGREEEQRQGGSSLHHSSPEYRGLGGGMDTGVTGGREREILCGGGGVGEGAATQHSHQLPSIHHLPQRKGCFISVSCCHIMCMCVCTWIFTDDARRAEERRAVMQIIISSRRGCYQDIMELADSVI
ncbi:hypothetical protein NQZ68_014186 [Dissostichus eleginoides]|nr:hypothetical protein NQZ68_014186 [Dissostichus eleginoides]